MISTKHFGRILPAAVFLAAVTTACPARADLSSWFFAGGGGTWLSERGSDYELRPTMQFDIGAGSAPSDPVIIGALARSSTYFGSGTDLGLALRAATGGFVRGGFGLALDAGAYKRWWGMGSFGPMGSLQLGAPYGLQLSINAALGTNEHLTFGATFGIDLLRLTVYRVAGEQWWPNPRPAYRPASDD